MRAPTGRTAVYRFYDADDRLLYIGISNNPDERLKQHGYTGSRWVPFAASRRIEWFDSREAAEAAEVAAIRAERPQFNGAHNFVTATFTPAIWSRPVVGWPRRKVIADRILAEISSGRWLPGTRIPSAGEIAAETKTSKSTTTKAIGPLIREGILSVHGGKGVFVEPYTPNE